MAYHEAGKVGVEALVAGDELVGEGEPGHLSALLEPEDGAEGAREEDALDAGKAHKARGERGWEEGPARRTVSQSNKQGNQNEG